MSVLVDTGVLYAHHDEDAVRAEVAAAVMDQVLAGALGTPVVTDYLHDEGVTLTLARAKSYGAAKSLSDRLLGRNGFPDAFRFVWVGEDGFERGLEVFETYPDQGLSFTDATSIAVMEQHGIDRILSFDDDFDGIVDRVDPREV